MAHDFQARNVFESIGHLQKMQQKGLRLCLHGSGDGIDSAPGALRYQQNLRGTEVSPGSQGS